MSDGSDIAQIEEKLREATRRLHALAPHVGAAKHVIRYYSDQTKSILARYALPHLTDGKSAAEANIRARANPNYQIEVDEKSKQHESAQVTLSEWEAAKCTYEAARSLLSSAKAYRELEREFEPR